MNKRNNGITNGEGLIALCLFVIAMIGFFFLVWKEGDEGTTSALSGAAVCKDFLAGKPISRDVFAETFENGLGVPNLRKIERIAEELDVPLRDMIKLVGRFNQSVVFVGSKDDVPAKLRPVAQPAEVPATQQSVVPE